MTPPSPPPSLAAWLAAAAGERFRAGEILIAPDSAPTHVFHLREGLVRLYSLDAQGAGFNHAFLGAGDWVFGRMQWRGDALCCSDQALGVAALQPTDAVRVDLADLERWQRDDPAVVRWLLELLVAFNADRLAREIGLMQRSAEARYRELIARQPDLLLRVPLHQIAAWLGITPVALSRIRRRVGPPT